MASFHSAGKSVPCLAEVDVLVIGSTAAAVVAALSARRAGASVYLVSERSYVGEELAAWFQAFPTAAELGPVLAPIFATAGDRPSPLTIKRLLDTALIEAGIPFLFQGRILSLLNDESGGVRGAVFAARCAWFAIKARHVIDASVHSVAARLGGWQSHLGGERPVDFAALIPATDGQGEIAIAKEGEPTQFFTVRHFRSSIETSQSTVADLSALEHKVRLESFTLEQARTSDSLRLEAPWKFQPIFDGCGFSIVGTAWLLSAEPDVRTLCYVAERTGVRAAALAAPRSIAGQLSWRGAGGELADSSEEIRFGPAPLRWDELASQVPLADVSFDLLAEVDVLVIGGGTGGASAAIGAARAGAKTLLIEALPGLGGVGTLGMIGRYWFGNRVGFTAEIDKGVEALGEGAPGGCVNGTWNAEWKMAWYLREIDAAGGTVWFGAASCGVLARGNRVTGVLVSTPFGCGLVRARVVIDATGNADIAAAAGAPCRFIGADHVAVQGTGLPPRKPLVGYRNTDYTFVDENDPANITQSFVAGRDKFSDEFDLAPIIDTRERRQIVGDLELSPLDFLADRTFPDTFVIAKSNFDTHGFTVHPVFMAFPPDKKPLHARVPFRCLLPKGTEGVLVTGLGVSAHRDAIPVIRMQPDVQNQGYAAGIAAAMSVEQKRGLRDLPMRELQGRLVDCGILPAEVLTQEDSFPLPAAEIEAAVNAAIRNHGNAAVIFGNPKASIPLLKARLADTSEMGVAEDAGMLLGMMGEAAAAPVLIRLLSDATAWDKGWNYTGMGQFGMSLSRLDNLIIALGRTGDRAAVPVLREKIASLVAESEFSHCRALAVAAICLQSVELAAPLAEALKLPGMMGHAWTDFAAVVKDVPRHPEETAARNLSLRELMLARALYLCGDCDGLGRRILEQYAIDLRGHYSNHARAILREGVETAGAAGLERRLAVA